jgi:Zn-dependent protease
MSESELDRTSSQQAEARRLEMIGLLRAQLAGILDDARTVWEPSADAPGLAGQLARRLGSSRTLVAFRGHLIMEPGEGFRLLRQRFETLGYTPTLHREGEWEVITALPAVFEQSQPQRPWINLLLFAVTFLTTAIMGVWLEQGELLLERGLALFLEQPWRLLTGIPMALTIMGILGLHELAHYFAARRHKLDTSLPYFIPVPFGLGTFGAIIRTRTPWENRNALFDVGVAGPIAGIIVALPLFFLGLMASEAMLPTAEGTPLGTPLLLGWMEDIVYQVRGIPAEYELYISAWAFAAWFGIVVSGFNLMPIGQLDGGHVAYALFGKYTRYLGGAVLVAIAVMGFVLWPGWFVWLIFTLLSGWMHPPPLNMLEPLSKGRIVLGIGVLILTALIFTPVPFPVAQ